MNRPPGRPCTYRPVRSMPTGPGAVSGGLTRRRESRGQTGAQPGGVDRSPDNAALVTEGLPGGQIDDGRQQERRELLLRTGEGGGSGRLGDGLGDQGGDDGNTGLKAARYRLRPDQAGQEHEAAASRTRTRSNTTLTSLTRRRQRGSTAAPTPEVTSGTPDMTVDRPSPAPWSDPVRSRAAAPHDSDCARSTSMSRTAVVGGRRVSTWASRSGVAVLSGRGSCRTGDQGQASDRPYSAICLWLPGTIGGGRVVLGRLRRLVAGGI